MQDVIHDAIDWIVPWVEAVGAALIVGGVVIAIVRVLWAPFMRNRPPLAALQVRIGLGLSLALGLEFLLAADILRTAVAPTYKDVALLAAIAAIRTGLNYFLGREFVSARAQIDALNAATLDHRMTGTPTAPIHHGPTREDASKPAAEERRGPIHRIGSNLRDALKGPLWTGSELTRREPEARDGDHRS